MIVQSFMRDFSVSLSNQSQADILWTCIYLVYILHSNDIFLKNILINLIDLITHVLVHNNLEHFTSRKAMREECTGTGPFWASTPLLLIWTTNLWTVCVRAYGRAQQGFEEHILKYIY